MRSGKLESSRALTSSRERSPRPDREACDGTLSELSRGQAWGCEFEACARAEIARDSTEWRVGASLSQGWWAGRKNPQKALVTWNKKDLGKLWLRRGEGPSGGARGWAEVPFMGSGSRGGYGGRPWRATKRQPARGTQETEPEVPLCEVSVTVPSWRKAVRPCSCPTLHVSPGTASMDTSPPPTGSGHLLTHQPAPNISNQRKINHQGLSPLGLVHSALPHSSPACRLRKCPSGIPTTRGRVMTRSRRTPGSPAHPCLQEPGSSHPNHQAPGLLRAAGQRGPHA